MRDDRADQDLVHGVPPIAVSTGSTRANRTGSWKYIQPLYQDRVAPCNAACPAGIDIEGWMNLLREDKVAEARELLLRENPMPAVTGRLCDRPCHASCNRASFDGAVNIRAVERALGDLEQRDLVATPRTRRENVAVVGSGPAGLACAYHLVRLGYAATVFEAEPEAGGWLRYRAPEYRLPRAVLEREIERIRAAGVVIRCNVRVGEDVPWTELDRYDAVFLAMGARTGAHLDLEGDDIPAARPGEDFLHEVRAGARGTIGRRVVVVGGGDLAVDCARTALRLGSEAAVVFSGSRDSMTAREESVADAIAEGVRFEFGATPVSLETAEHVEDEPAIESVRTMFDAAGVDHPRTHLTGIECRRGGPQGERFVLPADTLLNACDADAEGGCLPKDFHRRGWAVRTDAFGETSRAGTFAGGDLADGAHSIAHALGAGKRGAIGIDRLLRGRAGDQPPALEAHALRWGGIGAMSITRWRGDDPVLRTNEKNEVVPFADLNMAYFLKQPGAPDRHRPLAPGGAPFAETDLGLTTAEALAESKRCFNCGVCNGCEVCMILCPDVAIQRHSSGHGFSLSYKFCKGCGLCVEECPRGAMTMTREGL